MSSDSDDIENKNYKDPALYYINYNFEIGDINNYIVDAKIGRGRYSDVYEGLQKITNEKVVLKILKPITKVKIKREICILKTLRKCPNIVQIIDVINEKDSEIFCIICKSISGTELKNCYMGITPEDLKYYMYKILECLEYTHRKKIMHRDIKLTNIAINTKTRELNIYDWGLSDFYIKDYKYTLTIGSRIYKAPELFMEYKKYDFSIDMWSVGCLFGAILFQTDFLFNGKSNQDQLILIAKQFGFEKIKNFLDKYKKDCFLAQKMIKKMKDFKEKTWDEFINDKNKYLINDKAIDLLNKLLEIDPEKRIKAKDAMNHPYFKS